MFDHYGEKLHLNAQIKLHERHLENTKDGQVKQMQNRILQILKEELSKIERKEKNGSD